jgi:hypothetical protein
MKRPAMCLHQICLSPAHSLDRSLCLPHTHPHTHRHNPQTHTHTSTAYASLSLSVSLSLSLSLSLSISLCLSLSLSLSLSVSLPLSFSPPLPLPLPIPRTHHCVYLLLPSRRISDGTPTGRACGTSSYSEKSIHARDPVAREIERNGSQMIHERCVRRTATVYDTVTRKVNIHSSY